MGELVSYVCVRADHQWATADAGQVHPMRDGFGCCADASRDAHEAHAWRACDGAVSAAAELAAYLGSVQSAAS